MRLAWATCSNTSRRFINHRLQPAALIYIGVCALICTGNTYFNCHCFICTAVYISDSLQVPEAFPRRTQHLLPAGISGCPSTHDVMPDGFSSSPLYACSGGRTVPASPGCEMAFRKRSKPWGVLEGSTGLPTLLCWALEVIRSHAALCSTWHPALGASWVLKIGDI